MMEEDDAMLYTSLALVSRDFFFNFFYCLIKKMLMHTESGEGSKHSAKQHKQRHRR